MEAAPRTQRIRELLLSVPNRRLVFEAIVRTPGAHLRQLARALGLAVGSVEHHLRHLHRHGLIFGHQEGRRRSYYAAGHVGREQAALLHALAHPVRQRIARALVRRDGAAVSDLASDLGSDVSTVSFHLRHLLKAGVVENLRAGRVSFYMLVDGARVARAVGLEGVTENFTTLVTAALASRRDAPRSAALLERRV